MAEQAGAQLDVDAVRRVREKIGAQYAEDRFEQRNGDQPNDEHVERAQGATDQHLVDDDLEEQRRDQREKLEEERGDEDLAEQMAVFVDGAEEPADVEAARKIHQSGATCHQHKTAVPNCLELVARHRGAVAATADFERELGLRWPCRAANSRPSCNAAMPGSGVLLSLRQLD